MLCGELLNGGFVSTGAVPVIPYGLLGFWLPGCLRATSPTSLNSSYLTLLAELLATGHLDHRSELMDLAKRSRQAPTNGAVDLDLDLHADDIDENVFLENGLLSFENPNYHLDPARLDDALNSNENGSSLYDELYQELVGNGGRSGEVTGGGGGGGGGGGTRVQARRTYATLDLGSMGVDVTQGPLTQDSVTEDAPDNTDNHNLGYCEKADNETTEMGGVPHVEGGLNSELYAVPVKRRQPKDQKNNTTVQNNTQEKPAEVDTTDSEDKDENLPPGWQKHEDENGPYYWHVKSGNIQREPPEAPPHSKRESRRSLIKDNDSINNFHTLSGMVNTVTRSNTSSALDQELENKRKVELALKRRSYPARADSEGRDKPIRFAVRSLGWTEIAEEDLTPERSSKAVNKCIVDLSLGRNDLLDVVGRWGDGKDLFMDLDEGALKLIDPENLTVLNTQPIHTVRVWGVGRDHCRERDFAYVARDRSTRKHMCHVFRCDIPARTIANTLRDICKKIMIERSQHQNLAKPVDINGRTSLATRPTNLPTEHRRFHRNGQALVTQSFPTPMEEPKKVLRAQYLGSMQVSQATGMEVLNDAIDHIVTNTPINQWRNVNVAVAPSMISILTPNEEKLITECRVRYLSFLGIGRNVKQCAFIMHTAQDLFIAHVFNCEPSSGALCKTIEAACKLRYQKCLDAHPQGFRNASSLNTPSGKGLGATLKSLVGSLTGRRNKQGTVAAAC
ncbi:protein Fe65 homolog isoform X3 [Bombus vosnesenskii]|uniref:Protein Fe65 homolog isoform X3 n=3 Tax=Pyrobombus TaxID=144703 RepID=A0A6J3KTB2_9HYME|nr:protein Fe65 homolog isoform X4 [Bombus impatiens]XP_033191606.1 protein Fe65 homolog isoform X3 [Bombus vancouverensis nearcticus]XP_033302109.1 protein Fe65 homolog isoform X3 [Bombus bifarius]XP_033356337.1 protein Fe65 homolog isoform X3 [Bombus vosnesenskii]